LSVGYRLSQNPDLASDALALESNCLGRRNVQSQACVDPDRSSECKDNAEIAFRRCIASIPTARFSIALTPFGCDGLGVEELVDLRFPLSHDDAVHPRLNRLMPHLRSARYFGEAGVWVEVGTDSCTFRNIHDSSQTTLPDEEELCFALLGYCELNCTAWAAHDGRAFIPNLPFYAIHYCRDSLADLLFSRGADIVPDRPIHKQTFLHEAIGVNCPEEWSRLRLVDVLIKHGIDVNAKDMSGDTALHLASKDGHKFIVYSLVEAGADVDVTNDKGETAIDYAQGEIRDYLLERSARK
jgi:hypothetical protein